MMKPKKHAHYHKKCPYEYVDVYRVLELFEVTNSQIAHAIKKLLVAGGRGHKNIDKDIQEAIDSLERWQEMRQEELFFSKNSENYVLDKTENKWYDV